MPYEIDLLAVGEEGKSGDAIAVRFGPALHRDHQTVLVVDGGFHDTGPQLVHHIQRYYQTDHIDIMVSTHPDGDHVNGLLHVMENTTVGELLMHRPWMHVDERQRRTLRNTLTGAVELESAALERGVLITEPFAGLQRFGVLTVLGPSPALYYELVPQFRPLLSTAEQLAAQLIDRIRGSVLVRVLEDLFFETLTDEGETSAENNTSVILHLNLDGGGILLTGDAGLPALEPAVELFKALGLDIAPLNLLHVPHHGSRRNVGPTILNRLIGPIGGFTDTSAVISCARNGAPKHPSARVMNALTRRGVDVYTTAGSGFCYPYHPPGRPGWGLATPHPLHEELDDDDH